MSTTVSFGPPGEEWHYSKTSKTFDLTGGLAKKLKIATTPADTYVTIPPDATALVIVDMQNFFLDKKCMAHPNGLKAVEPTIQAIEACRQAGIQIIWLNWGLTDRDLKTLPAGVHRGFMKDVISETNNPLRPYTGLGSDLGSGRGRCLYADSWNAAIYPPLAEHVQPSDIHCAKNRMSGMWNSEQPLWKALKAKGIETVLFTGVNTDQCVLGTLVDAYNAGWNCILIQDCCGTNTPGAKEVTERNVANCYGFIIDSTSLVAATKSV